MSVGFALLKKERKKVVALYLFHIKKMENRGGGKSPGTLRAQAHRLEREKGRILQAVQNRVRWNGGEHFVAAMKALPDLEEIKKGKAHEQRTTEEGNG